MRQNCWHDSFEHGDGDIWLIKQTCLADQVDLRVRETEITLHQLSVLHSGLILPLVPLPYLSRSSPSSPCFLFFSSFPLFHLLLPVPSLFLSSPPSLSFLFFSPFPLFLVLLSLPSLSFSSALFPLFLVILPFPSLSRSSSLSLPFSFF